MIFCSLPVTVIQQDNYQSKLNAIMLNDTDGKFVITIGSQKIFGSNRSLPTEKQYIFNGLKVQINKVYKDKIDILINGKHIRQIDINDNVL